jgi:hypothetical protein
MRYSTLGVCPARHTSAQFFAIGELYCGRAADPLSFSGGQLKEIYNLPLRLDVSFDVALGSAQGGVAGEDLNVPDRAPHC